MDRFHSIYSVGRKTSRRIHVVRGETDKKASDIQARSFMARTLDENTHFETHRGMMVKPDMIFGLFQEILFTVITWNPAKKCTCRLKNHSLLH